MWDPRTYVDTDFGLEDDEAFEPEDSTDTGVDPATDPHVMTVLGAVSPDDLGICLPYEHLLIDAPGNEESGKQLNDVMRAIEELTHFVTVGGQTLVDATTREHGRDILGLRQIARLVPAHIITVTGGQSRPGLDIPAFADEIQQEITAGIGPRNVRPGLIVATLTGSDIEEHDRALLHTLAGIGVEAGLPLYLDGDNLAILTKAVRIVLKTSLPAQRVIMKMPESAFAHSLLQELMSGGCRIVFTGIGKGNADHERAVAGAVAKFAAQGQLKNVLVSQGLDHRSQLLAWNGSPGWVYMLERFVLTLMDAGLPATSVRTLLIDNPADALTIFPG